MKIFLVFNLFDVLFVNRFKVIKKVVTSLNELSNDELEKIFF